MAYQNNSTPGSGYGNQYIDSLVWGCQWTNTGAWGQTSTASPVNITYSFGEGVATSGTGTFIGASWFDSEKLAFETALNLFENVCNVDFSQTAYTPSYANQSNTVFYLTPDSFWGGSGILGMFEVPDGTYTSNYGYFGYEHPSWNNLNSGSYGFITIIHELGHGLGLAHPHDGGTEASATTFPGVTSSSETGLYGLNQGIWTTMSYVDGWNQFPSNTTDYGYQSTPMAFDVAALQAIYGVNTSYQTGSDTYYLPTSNTIGTGWACIWDAGGTDTISNEGSLIGSTINLNAASLVGENAGGFVSKNAGITGGFTIANAVVIENAIGGDGNDYIIGNDANNSLDGGAGNDLISGSRGDDTIDGGAGYDIALYETNRSSITSATRDMTGIVTFQTEFGTDSLINIEEISFQNGNVTIDDIITQHSPAVYQTNVGLVTANIYTGAVNFLEFELLGSSTGDIVTGATSNDFINLLGGDDAANGGDGQDVLDGGTGSNFLTGGSGADTFFLDGRSGTNTWSTITDFTIDDSVNIWGWQDNTSQLILSLENQGADGFKGATFHYDLNGDNSIDTSITFSGLVLASLPGPSSEEIAGNGYILFS